MGAAVVSAAGSAVGGGVSSAGAVVSGILEQVCLGRRPRERASSIRHALQEESAGGGVSATGGVVSAVGGGVSSAGAGVSAAGTSEQVCLGRRPLERESSIWQALQKGDMFWGAWDRNNKEE